LSKSIVSVVRYEKPLDSVRLAAELSGGLDRLSAGSKVFIKPNVVFWTRKAPFPKWGVVTTSRVVEDMVLLLKEYGVRQITIGEGPALPRPNDRETPAHAFRSLGYYELKSRYGVRVINIFEEPFHRVDLGDGIMLDFNREILKSDFVVNLPVLKTHAQTVVSLGIKNFKGTIDFESRKRCHNADPKRDLHYMVSRLFLPMPPTFTLLDGIYTNERGPNTDGRARRSNLLIASSDVLSADMVGAGILGYSPKDVPHLVHAARAENRPLDLSDIEIVGERIEAVTAPHDFAFPYNQEGTLPLSMEKMGITGLSYRKYDLTICTFCSGLNRLMLMATAAAWKGEPFPDVEVLTGKIMKPNPGRKKTILLGKCVYERNKGDERIQEMIPIKGCPPDPKGAYKALTRAGIDVDPVWFENPEKLQQIYMKKYTGKPEFDDSFFTVSG
jgi:uncharacterized protein (DUF362 family)